MEIKRSLSFFLAAVMAVLLCPFDGVRSAETIHRDVWMKNEYGERITPRENAEDPYSPRKTCGSCHAYSTITSGFHFQQGFDEMSDSYDPRKPWILSPGMYGKW